MWCLLLRTVCGDALQHIGRHYDLHNLYGWSQVRSIFRELTCIQSEPTLEGVRSALGTRGLILSRCDSTTYMYRFSTWSRSTFLGSGRWAAHWLGDNWSLWSNLHYSIIGMLQVKPSPQRNIASPVQSVWDPLGGRRHMRLHWDHKPRDVCQVPG